jgi:hypothetical protein
MGKVADKIAAHCVDVENESGDAISVSTPFDVIRKIANLSIPLRRPKRRCPSRENEQDYLDADAAIKALKDTEGISPYNEFRSELGLDG